MERVIDGRGLVAIAAHIEAVITHTTDPQSADHLRIIADHVYRLIDEDSRRRRFLHDRETLHLSDDDLDALIAGLVLERAERWVQP